MLVVNTDQSNEPGKHWVSFYFLQNRFPEFVDSLGKLLEYYHKFFQNILVTHGPPHLHNLSRIQDYNSYLCGE
jgi:hypothetical protein